MPPSARKCSKADYDRGPSADDARRKVFGDEVIFPEGVCHPITERFEQVAEECLGTGLDHVGGGHARQQLQPL
jgi:hypothetical protein